MAAHAAATISRRKGKVPFVVIVTALLVALVCVFAVLLFQPSYTDVAVSAMLSCVGMALAAGLMYGASTLSAIRRRTEDAILISRSKHGSK